MRLFIIILSAIGLAAGCGGGGGGSNFQPSEDQSASGFWDGTVDFSTGESLGISGVIAENNEAIFVLEDDQMLWGVASVTNRNQLAVDFTWTVPPLTETPDGAIDGTGTLLCTIMERVSMECTFTSTSSAGEPFEGVASVAYDDLYERDSSIAAIAGNWIDSETGEELLSIDGAGRIFSQDPISGCILSGTVRPIDTAYNAYDVVLTIDGCNVDFAELNGVRFDGLAALVDDLQPEDTLIMALHTQIMGFAVGLPAEYRRQ